jgi:hypothetical protein
MTTGGVIGPPDDQNEKAARTKSGSLDTATETDPKISSATKSVKLVEARQHLARWRETGHEYHLRLARAKFAALRKEAA